MQAHTWYVSDLVVLYVVQVPIAMPESVKNVPVLQNSALSVDLNIHLSNDPHSLYYHLISVPDNLSQSKITKYVDEKSYYSCRDTYNNLRYCNVSICIFSLNYQEDLCCF